MSVLKISTKKTSIKPLSKRKCIGLVEKVTLKGKKKTITIDAKIDTGAVKSSIDSKLASELKLGPIVGSRIIKNTHGSSVRVVIQARIVIAGVELTAKFTVADRKRMKYKLLIGQNVLKKAGFLIDPLKTTR
ncbi:ATP-dependent zinc protease [Candidatus Woesearchaeota archaeon]|nr:ATP-dependent zinc protease [Candidatus Woesearchaeota archaeon]